MHDMRQTTEADASPCIVEFEWIGTAIISRRNISYGVTAIARPSTQRDDKKGVHHAISQCHADTSYSTKTNTYSQYECTRCSVLLQYEHELC